MKGPENARKQDMNLFQMFDDSLPSLLSLIAPSNSFRIYRVSWVCLSTTTQTNPSTASASGNQA